jgi:uncharacterized protein (DUF2062 family)
LDFEEQMETRIKATNAVNPNPTLRFKQTPGDHADRPNAMAGGLLKRKILSPILDLLRQGMTPEKMALSIALGITLGVTPVLGFTSALCFMAAVLLGLNSVAIQLVNYLVYPLQIVLLIPFIRIGEWLFAAQPMKLSAERILSLIRQNVWTAISTLWVATMHAMVAWLVFGSLASLFLYLLLVPALRKFARSQLRKGEGWSGLNCGGVVEAAKDKI